MFLLDRYLSIVASQPFVKIDLQQSHPVVCILALTGIRTIISKARITLLTLTNLLRYPLYTLTF